jgi:hypothetical protein
MSKDRLFLELSTPAGNIIRVGDIYINEQGIELKVTKILKPGGESGVYVEMAPTDERLNDACWQGYLLVLADPVSEGAVKRTPRVYIEDMDKLMPAA